MTLELETFRRRECCGFERTMSVYLNTRHCISLSAIVQRYSTFWDWTCSRWSLLVTLQRAARWLRCSSTWAGFTFTLKSKSVWEFFLSVLCCIVAPVRCQPIPIIDCIKRRDVVLPVPNVEAPFTCILLFGQQGLPTTMQKD